MSEFFSARSHSLSYEALEIACHAIDTYRERLCLGQYEELKVCAVIVNEDHMDVLGFCFQRLILGFSWGVFMNCML